MHEVTHLINAMPEDRLETLLTLLAEEAIEVLEPPRTGLIMMTINDSFNMAFHPGEVLVTEARVRIRDCEGWGMVVGEEPRRAVVKAAVDGILRLQQLNRFKQRVMNLLAEERRLQQTALAEEKAFIAATKVEFDLMSGA